MSEKPIVPDAMLEEKVISKEEMFRGKLIRVEHWQVKLPNGHTSLREVALHNGAAGVVAVDDEGKVVMVRQHRIAVGRMTWEVPAGKLDSPDEDPLHCAKRELSEETGLEADSWEKLICLETTPGFCTERIHLYLARGLHQGATHPDEDEFVATKREPIGTLVNQIMKGEIRDGKTIVAIMMAAERLRSTNI